MNAGQILLYILISFILPHKAPGGDGGGGGGVGGGK